MTARRGQSAGYMLCRVPTPAGPAQQVTSGEYWLGILIAFKDYSMAAVYPAVEAR